MRDWKGYTVLHSMSKQSEGIVLSGRNSPFAGRVWAIAEAERGAWEIRTLPQPVLRARDVFVPGKRGARTRRAAHLVDQSGFGFQGFGFEIGVVL